MRILVVEDEPKVASFIRRALEEESYAVDVCADGPGGLDWAQAVNYDLIVLDLMLPGLPGLEVLKRARAAGVKAPVLILTARSEVDQRVKGLDAGADDYLTKPFAIEELLARARALLRRAGGAPTGILQVDDVILNPVTREVTRAGQRLEFTTKEYALLEYLMRNAGRVLTRSMITEHVWDLDFDTFTNVIDVYISYLRNKIDKGRERSLIQTVRGERIYDEVGRVKTTSIRVRLTLWYGSALALILVLFAVALYLVMSRALREQVDASLDEAAAVAIRTLGEHRFGPFLIFEDLSQDFPEIALLDKFFQIFGPAGQVTIQSANIQSREIPLSQTSFRASLDGKSTFESVQFEKGVPLRLLSVPIRQDDQLVNILRVGTSLYPTERMLHRLLAGLYIASPLALLVSLVGGWFLAGRALRPVHAITQAAQRIAAGDWTQRIQTPHSNDEIGQLASTFNDMIGRLEVSFRQIRQFSADASHELRTPLTITKGETELALRRPRQAEDYRAVLESNLEEIDRMSRIVDELLFLSRADLGEIKLKMFPVQLDDLVREIQQQALVLGQERNIHTVLEAIEPVVVQGDDLRLRELLLNLVDNAVKYSQEGQTVELSLVVAGNKGKLVVKDHGIGLAPEDHGRIFDRFYRTDEARAHAAKGTGLGLAICKWIVEVHHGTIEVQSVVHGGSCFTVFLPLAPTAAKV